MTTRYADDATLARIAELEAENAALKEAAIAAVKEGGPVAWLTYMKNDEVGLWPTYEEACSYCEDEVFPTPLYAAPKEST